MPHEIELYHDSAVCYFGDLEAASAAMPGAVARMTASGDAILARKIDTGYAVVEPLAMVHLRTVIYHEGKAPERSVRIELYRRAALRKNA